MRGLSHFWRVTRQDNIAAQALLEKAIAIDPNYGQALGVLAPAIFGAHMGWSEISGRPLSAAERAALAAIRADSEDAWAHLALAAASIVKLRRFDDSLAEFELALRLNPNFSLAQGLVWPCAVILRPLGGGQRGRPPRAAAEPARSAFCHLQRHCRLCAVRRTQLRRSDALGARESSVSAVDFVGAHRMLTAAAGMAGETEIARAALRELRRAQPNISLAWIAEPDADQARLPSVSTIWKPSAAPAWSSPVCRSGPRP